LRTVREIIEEAFALHEKGDFVGAGAVYDHLLGITAGEDANVLYAYGTLLATEGHNGLAMHLLKAAIAVYPDHAPSWTNLALALKNFGNDKAAQFALDKALELEPEAPEALNNMAGLYINQGQPEKVIEWAARAVEKAPDKPSPHNHLALGLLEAGRYAEAWPHYEHRWNLPDRIAQQRPYKAPKWTGEKVGTLAIHGEQGLGDEILFMGCFKEAARRADRVVIECAPRLVDLFHASFSVPCYGTHAELIASEGEPDAYVSMGSLPGIVGMPSGESYLVPPIMHFDQARPTVALAWKGGTPKTNKRERSLKLEQLRPLLEVPGINFVSVQYGGDSVTEEAKAAGLNHFPNPDLEIISGRIGACNLVISVCQTAVHLAGAFGKPCWVLTPKRCAWRYAGGVTQMPWYKSVTLYRQDDTELWGPVIERIAADLRLRYA
jgi:Tfp pilus assembly protein PilF